MIPPAVRAPVDAAPDTVNVAAETAPVVVNVPADTSPDEARLEHAIDPVPVMLFAPSASVPDTVRAPVLDAPETTRVAAVSDVVLESELAAISPADEMDPKDPAPVAVIVVNPVMDVVPTMEAHVTLLVPALMLPVVVSAPVEAAPETAKVTACTDVEDATLLAWSAPAVVIDPNVPAPDPVMEVNPVSVEDPVSDEHATEPVVVRPND
jgi:hypothetical protein